MAMIYNRADGVLVWLGESSESFDRAVPFIHRLLNLDNFDPLTRDPGTTTKWAALIELMQRPWFSRRWIVQEISLARKATVYCGDDAVSWHDFAAAIALLVSRNADLRSILQTPKNLEDNDWLVNVDALGAKFYGWPTMLNPTRMSLSQCQKTGYFRRPSYRLSLIQPLRKTTFQITV
ncbi:HET-domain-containing protein [Colletotrichum tofieldiae]|nr:HET-domain-containing protein [Colletotrichum tofieldiae]